MIHREGDLHVVRGVDRLGLDERVPLARHLLRRLRGMMTTAYVDGFSDVQELPHEVADALSKIRERAPLQPRLLGRPKRTYMAIPLSVRDALEFDLVAAFAPYSIHAEVVGGNDVAVLVLHDTSTGIEMRADAATMTAIENDLPAGLVLER